MEEEDRRLRQQFGHKNPFVVPEGYFDTITFEIVDKISEKRNTIVGVRASAWVRFRPALLGAASIFIAVFSILFYLSNNNQDTSRNNVVVAAKTEYSASYGDLDLAVDYTMLDNEDIYHYVSEN